MVWRNYYRPKQRDPYSIAALERLSEAELLQKKKYYENTIKLIEKQFDPKIYQKFQKNIPVKEVSKLSESINKKFLKIEKYILVDTKYYAQRSFFGSLKNGAIMCNVTCETNKDTKAFLKEFEFYTNYISKFTKADKENTLFNERISNFVNSQKDKDQIKNIDRIYGVDSQTTNYVGYDILSNISTNIFDYNGERIPLTHYSIRKRDAVEYPLRSKDKYWQNAFECSVEEFDEIDDVHSYVSGVKDRRRAKTTINICGDFFKEIERISKSNSFYYLTLPYSEDFLVSLKEILLKFYNTYLRKITLLNRSRIRQDSIEENFNNVYVLSNKSYDGIFKVGWTTNLAEERAEQLSAETGVLYPFKVVFSKKFKNAEKIEKKIHVKFKKNRVRGNKEYFKIEKEKLIEFIKSIES